MRENYPYITAIWPKSVPTYRDARECIHDWLTGIDIVVLRIASGFKACDHSECAPGLGLCSGVLDDLYLDGSTAQFEWFHRVCGIATTLDLASAVACGNMDAVAWSYHMGMHYCQSHISTDDTTAYEWCIERKLDASLRVPQTTAEIIAQMPHNPEVRHRMTFMSLHTPDDIIAHICERVIAGDPLYYLMSFTKHGTEIARLRGYLPKMIDCMIGYTRIMPAAAEIIINAKKKRDIMWWLETITADESTYPQMAAFLDKLIANLTLPVIHGTFYMSPWAIRWLVENNHLHHGCTIQCSDLPVETMLAYIDYVQNYIEIGTMIESENIPIIEALVARGLVLKPSHMKAIARIATSSQLCRLGIHGKKYIKAALHYGNVLGLDYLYAKSQCDRKHPLTWKWFMKHVSSDNYEWIRRRVPRPRDAVYVMRRFHPRLLNAMREDKLTVFVHSDTVMSELDAEWLMRT